MTGERDGPPHRPSAGASRVIAPRARVVMHFTLRLAQGTELESTLGGEPLCFTVGDGTLDPRLERLLLGLREGERCQLAIAPDEVYGYPDPTNVHTLARCELPESPALAPGMLIAFETPSGQEVPGYVQALTESEVTVDFNHPLAGRRLVLEVEVLEVEAT